MSLQELMDTGLPLNRKERFLYGNSISDACMWQWIPLF